MAEWHLAGHVSELPQAGDCLVFELLGECVIVVRDGGWLVGYIARYGVDRRSYRRSRTGAKEARPLQETKFKLRHYPESDKLIIGKNREGIRSRFYEPGPFAPMEAYTRWFVDHYLSVIA